MAKRKPSRSIEAWAFVAFVVVAGAAAFSSGVTSHPSSQLAVGVMADQMCASSRADARCQCNQGFDARGNCSSSVRGGGKIGCPCHDITAGQVAASGKCAQVGKCLADQAGGMMPMLPMIPMPMPMPSMSSQEGCAPRQTASSTQATSTDWGVRGTSGSVPCDPYASMGAGEMLWSNNAGEYGGFSDALQGDFSVDLGNSQNLVGAAQSPAQQAARSVWTRLVDAIVPTGTGQSDSEKALRTRSAAGSTTIRADFTLLPGETAPVSLWEKVFVSSDGINSDGTYNDPDSGRAFGESTFSYTHGPEAERGLLERIASTLKQMLATIGAWTQ